jgi:hypothetical protein
VGDKLVHILGHDPLARARTDVGLFDPEFELDSEIGEGLFDVLKMIGHFDSSGSQSLRRGVYRSIDSLPTRQ